MRIARINLATLLLIPLLLSPLFFGASLNSYPTERLTARSTPLLVLTLAVLYSLVFVLRGRWHDSVCCLGPLCLPQRSRKPHERNARPLSNTGQTRSSGSR